MYSNKYVIELIEDAIEEEMEDNGFYTALANTIRDVEDKKIIKEMALDELKHHKMLHDIYEKLTGKPYTMKDDKEIEIDTDFIKNIINAINDELDAVEEYRPILFALENQQLKNYLMEIITDEQNHAARLNYIYSKYK